VHAACYITGSYWLHAHVDPFSAWVEVQVSGSPKAASVHHFLSILHQMKGLLCAPFTLLALLSVVVNGDTQFFPYNFAKGPFKYSPPIPHLPVASHLVTAQALSSSFSTNKTASEGFVTIEFECPKKKVDCKFFSNALSRLKFHLEEIFDFSVPIG
jgi:hypothetical protein